MYGINIDINTLLGIIAIGIVILFIVIMIFIATMYHMKRKYDSINDYNTLLSDKFRTYNEQLQNYNKNIEKSGVKTKHESTIILLIKKGIRDVFH